MNTLKTAMKNVDQQLGKMMVLQPPPKFSHERFDQMVDGAFKTINRLSKLKGGEYSGDEDRLLNFRRNAEALGLTMEQVWAVYAAKHWDAIMQSIRDIQTNTVRERGEPLEGRVMDLIVYLLLFRAMLEEHNENIRT